MIGATDWAHVGFSDNIVPSSCCKEVPEGSKCDSNSIHIHSNGCMNNFQSAIEHNALILGGVGIGIAVIQVIFICFF